MINVLGYYIHKEDTEINSWTVMVLFDSGLTGGKIEGYSPQESHFTCDRDYIEDCKEITKAQYLNASKLFYTPEEYLIEDEEAEEEEAEESIHYNSNDRMMKEAGHRQSDFI